MMHEDFKQHNGLQIRPVNHSSLKDYSQLLASSFQSFRPSIAYLNWLYFENPQGTVMGYDAFDGKKLVAHYACVPINIHGYQLNSLLSLNTATHPAYQGQGLFSALARQTYESAHSTFANVIGVANSNSIGGFIKHLGFSRLGSLDLRLGRLSRQVVGSKNYTRDDLIWRSKCPERPLNVLPLKGGSSLVEAKPFRFAPKLKAIVYEDSADLDISHSRKVGLTLDWRKDQYPLLWLPKRLKPSPLHLIFKPLLEADSSIITSFSFPDFDAF